MRPRLPFEYQQQGYQLDSFPHLSPTQWSQCYHLVLDAMTPYYPTPDYPLEKQQEMQDPSMWYLLHPHGFASFQLCQEDLLLRRRTKRIPVLYLYELHVGKEWRGQGWGSTMLKVVEEIGRESGCEQVRLTVHKENQGAIRLYKRHQYETDSTCPSLHGIPATYWILSKNLKECAP
jgi:GNAT superfamily N-acetyltransferase